MPKDDNQTTDDEAVDDLQAKVADTELAELKAQIKLLTIENGELLAKLEDPEHAEGRLKDMAARAQADLQNAKERMEREAQTSRMFALQSFMVKFLPQLDTFKKAVEHLTDEQKEDEVLKGFVAVEQGMIAVLKEQGLEEIDALGAQVDPELHEVLMNGDGPTGEIIEVFEAGYMLKGKVVRAAKVKVGG